MSWKTEDYLSLPLGEGRHVFCLSEDTWHCLESFLVVTSGALGFQARALGFPHSSVGKESACNAGDLGSIPGLQRSAGEGIGYPLQYAWASLVAQTVKNLPAMWRDLGSIPGWGRSPAEGKGYPLQYPGLKNSMVYTVHGVAKCRRTERLN